LGNLCSLCINYKTSYLWYLKKYCPIGHKAKNRSDVLPNFQYQEQKVFRECHLGWLGTLYPICSSCDLFRYILPMTKSENSLVL
jgi:hypothetical protein